MRVRVVGPYSWDCLCCANVLDILTNYSVTSKTRVEDWDREG